MRAIIKRLCAGLLAVLIAAAVFGCQKESPTPESISSALLECGAFDDPENYASLAASELEALFGFDSDLLGGFSVYISREEEDFTELGVFKPNNKDDRNTIIDGINNRLVSTVDGYNALAAGGGAGPADSLLMELDGMVIYAIPDEKSAAEECLLSLGATEIN